MYALCTLRIRRVHRSLLHELCKLSVKRAAVLFIDALLLSVFWGGVAGI